MIIYTPYTFYTNTRGILSMYPVSVRSVKSVKMQGASRHE